MRVCSTEEEASLNASVSSKTDWPAFRSDVIVLQRAQVHSQLTVFSMRPPRRV
jgi:hypothetical protein